MIDMEFIVGVKGRPPSKKRSRYWQRICWWANHVPEVRVLRARCAGPGELGRLAGQQIRFVDVQRLTPTAWSLVQLLLFAMVDKGYLGLCGGAESLCDYLGCSPRAFQEAVALLARRGLLLVVPDVETVADRIADKKAPIFVGRKGRAMTWRERDALLVPTDALLDAVEKWVGNFHGPRRQGAFWRWRQLGTQILRTVGSAVVLRIPEQSPVDSGDNSVSPETATACGRASAPSLVDSSTVNAIPPSPTPTPASAEPEAGCDGVVPAATPAVDLETPPPAAQAARQHVAAAARPVDPPAGAGRILGDPAASPPDELVQAAIATGDPRAMLRALAAKVGRR